MSGYRKSATLCVICGDRCRHGLAVIVSRTMKGTPRLLCCRRSCRKAWEERGAEIAAKWPENRPENKGQRRSGH